MLTVPIGPQIQALHRSPESAEQMRWRWKHTRETLAYAAKHNGDIGVVDDFCCGADYLDAVLREDIQENDTVLMFSIDGAQLYQHKQSDCWFGIWIVNDLSPELRYKKKKVVPAFIVPGPNPPKDMDSFFFVTLFHLIAVQREGLLVWDAAKKAVIRKNLWLALVLADTPAMAYLSGWVGHHGAFPCRLLCPLQGRHKSGAPTYYAAHLRPDNYDHVPASSHPDFDVHNLPQSSVERYNASLRYLLESRNNTTYIARRRETGLSKPSIFLAVPRNRISTLR